MTRTQDRSSKHKKKNPFRFFYDLLFFVDLSTFFRFFYDLSTFSNFSHTLKILKKWDFLTTRIWDSWADCQCVWY